MPPSTLIDLREFDRDQIVVTREQIYSEVLPHRFEFMLLDGVCMIDRDALRLVAYADIKPDAWWVRGHVEGRPLFPGVLMLEMAAQTSAITAKLVGGNKSFIGFGGVQACKFRDSVVPPARLHILCVGKEYRARRVVSMTQGVVGDRMIFEAEITGFALP